MYIFITQMIRKKIISMCIKKGFCINILLLFVHLVFFLSPCSAMPSNYDHADLWLSCVGLSELNAMNSSFASLSSTIDKGLTDDLVKNSFYDKEKIIIDKISNDISDIRFGVDGFLHRKIFHWGLSSKTNDLNALPTAEPLRQLIDMRVKKMEGLTDQEKNIIRRSFIRIYTNEWMKRKKSFFETVRNEIVFEDAERASSYIEPFSVILYEIHILADFMDVRIEDLGDYDFHFENELITYGFKQLKVTKRRDKLIHDLEHAKSRTPPIKEKELEKMITETPVLFQNLVKDYISEDETVRRSLHLLVIIQKQLPSVLVENFPNFKFDLKVKPAKRWFFWE